MSRFRQQDNLLGQANSFLETLEQISQIAPLNKPVNGEPVKNLSLLVCTFCHSAGIKTTSNSIVPL